MNNDATQAPRGIHAVINLIVGRLDKRGDFKGGDLIDYRCRKIVPIAYFGILSIVVAVVFIFF